MMISMSRTGEVLSRMSVWVCRSSAMSRMLSAIAMTTVVPLENSKKRCSTWAESSLPSPSALAWNRMPHTRSRSAAMT